MFDLTNDTTFNHRVLDAVAARVKVAMHNLANKDTPGFKRFVVSFEDELRSAIADGKGFANVHPRVTRDESGTPGENNVIQYDEMALLEKTRALHEIFTRKIGGYFNKMNKAILGR